MGVPRLALAKHRLLSVSISNLDCASSAVPAQMKAKEHYYCRLRPFVSTSDWRMSLAGNLRLLRDPRRQRRIRIKQGLGSSRPGFQERRRVSQGGTCASPAGSISASYVVLAVGCCEGCSGRPGLRCMAQRWRKGSSNPRTQWRWTRRNGRSVARVSALAGSE